jgi:UPF0716 family protein affecting phage T7 exclusion
VRGRLATLALIMASSAAGGVGRGTHGIATFPLATPEMMRGEPDPRNKESAARRKERRRAKMRLRKRRGYVR